MNTFLFILMILLLIAALERTNRRQPPRPGLHGSPDRDDRDWARTKLDLLALGAQAEPFSHKPFTHKPVTPKPTEVWPAEEDSRSTTEQNPTPALRGWNINHRNGPRAV